jgi:hypothetical protein
MSTLVAANKWKQFFSERMKKTKRKVTRAQQQATELLAFPLEGNDRALHLEPCMAAVTTAERK